MFRKHFRPDPELLFILNSKMMNFDLKSGMDPVYKVGGDKKSILKVVV